MAQANSREFRTEGLYGTSIFDHMGDGLKYAFRDRYKTAGRLYTVGLTAMALGVIAYSADSVATLSRAGHDALLPGTQRTNPELRDFFEKRFPAEIGAISLGTVIVLSGIALQASEESERTKRRIVTNL